jgi:hypothetical protein
MQQIQKVQFVLLSAILVAVIAILERVYRTPRRWIPSAAAAAASSSGTCSSSTCGAVDDVNDPAYNMRNVVKQSILLEEHLAEPNKYCESCIVKHFQHVIGLLEEAVWLSGADVDKYPGLKDGAAFYSAQFETWRAARRDDTNIKQVLDALRARRRTLVDTYFLT